MGVLHQCACGRKHHVQRLERSFQTGGVTTESSRLSLCQRGIRLPFPSSSQLPIFTIRNPRDFQTSNAPSDLLASSRQIQRLAGTDGQTRSDRLFVSLGNLAKNICSKPSFFPQDAHPPTRPSQVGGHRWWQLCVLGGTSVTFQLPLPFSPQVPCVGSACWPLPCLEALLQG